MADTTNDFFIDAQPQVSVFIGENGNLQINVTQMNDAAEKIEFNSVELPMNLVEQIAQAMLRISNA